MDPYCYSYSHTQLYVFVCTLLHFTPLCAEDASEAFKTFYLSPSHSTLCFCSLGPAPQTCLKVLYVRIDHVSNSFSTLQTYRRQYVTRKFVQSVTPQLFTILELFFLCVFAAFEVNANTATQQVSLSATWCVTAVISVYGDFTCIASVSTGRYSDSLWVPEVQNGISRHPISGLAN